MLKLVNSECSHQNISGMKQISLDKVHSKNFPSKGFLSDPSSREWLSCYLLSYFDKTSNALDADCIRSLSNSLLLSTNCRLDRHNLFSMESQFADSANLEHLKDKYLRCDTRLEWEKYLSRSHIQLTYIKCVRWKQCYDGSGDEGNEPACSSATLEKLGLKLHFLLLRAVLVLAKTTERVH